MQREQPSATTPCCERDHDKDGNCDRHPENTDVEKCDYIENGVPMRHLGGDNFEPWCKQEVAKARAPLVADKERLDWLINATEFHLENFSRESIDEAMRAALTGPRLRQDYGGPNL